MQLITASYLTKEVHNFLNRWHPRKGGGTAARWESWETYFNEEVTMSFVFPFSNASRSEAIAEPTTLCIADTLSAWLRISDPTEGSAYLASHASVLFHPAASAMLARWIAHVPGELAPSWQARLDLLRASA